MRRILVTLIALGAAVGGAIALLRRRGAAVPLPWSSSDGGGGRLEYAGPGEGASPAGGGGSPDDARLLARVESELFRDQDLPKGDIVLDAVGGVITLRGEVERRLVEDIPVRVAAVEGVVRVENLLHPPGTPAPSAPA